MAEAELLVDPAVTRAKFARELEGFQRFEDDYMRRGILLVRRQFPLLFFVFAAPQLKPPAIVFGATVDFTNFDYWPPAVQLVDPFTQRPYTAGELPAPAWLKQQSGPPHEVRVVGPGLIVQPVQVQTLMQAVRADEVPFLCLRGVRAYHEHPGHSGDAWLLHRATGVGTLAYILEQLHKYGVQPVRDYGAQLIIRVSGFQEDQALA